MFGYTLSPLTDSGEIDDTPAIKEIVEANKHNTPGIIRVQCQTLRAKMIRKGFLGKLNLLLDLAGN